MSNTETTTPSAVPSAVPTRSHPFEVGKCYFLRTVTYHMVGRVTAIDGAWLTLEDSSWVADSGRFSSAIKKGTLSEVEPTGKSYVNTDSVTDAFPWEHPLPMEVK